MGSPRIEPPKAAIKFLCFFLKEEMQEEVIGDLEEQFQYLISKYSSSSANLRFWVQVLNYLRPFAIRKFPSPFTNQTIMFRHNFNISWRTILKHKGFSLLNIGGLALGMILTVLIALWVFDEIKYDRFHQNYDEIYQVIANRDFNGNIFTDRNMLFPLAKAIEEEIPQVSKSVWTTHPQSQFLKVGKNSIKKTGFSVGGPYFEMFSWKFLVGDAKTALDDPTSIILTESGAKALFGDLDPMQQSIQINNERDLRVTGIIVDPPLNSSLKFDYIMPFDYSDQQTAKIKDNWRNNYSWRVYVQADSKVDIAQLEGSITNLMQGRTEDLQSTHFLFPMRKWHLHNEFKDGINAGGAIRYVRLFGIVALIILLIACINYMNLSTARSEKRSLEIAVRKTLGSERRQLIQQFFIETILISALAFTCTIITVYFLLPSFNVMVNKELSINLLDPWLWLCGLTIILTTGIMAGCYPALYLSSFQPIKMLKGRASRHGIVLPRRVLVVFQFIASIALISSTILVHQQIQFIKQRDIGYDTNNLIMIPTNAESHEKYEVIRNKLQASPIVRSVTRSSSPITNIWWRFPSPQWEGKEPNLDILFNGLAIDVDFSKTIGTQIIQGADFSGSPSDSEAVLLNQSAISAMGIKNPIGKILTGQGSSHKIIGVIQDFVMESPFSAVDPLMVFFRDQYNYINIRLKDQVNPQEALKEIEAIFAEYVPEYPFEYDFVDQAYSEKLGSVELISKLINIFAMLAIFICCLGMAGMASFMIEKRSKEMAVRKVLGASLNQLLLLISQEFLWLVAIGFLLAVPFTYWLVNRWLLQYEYHISISPWIFLFVGIGVFTLTILVVGSNTLRAARSNPINALRSE